MGWRDILEPDDMAEFLAKQNPKPITREKVKSKNPTMLNIIDSGIRNHPNLDLLTEVELEAFNGWYATMRKPKFNLSHEEATIKAWQLLIESMESMYKRGGGRWLKKSD